MTQRNLFRDLFFYLTLAVGLIICISHIDCYGLLATGDHGICLYAFERTMHGEMPYKDYLWIYGPLMPYYYAFFSKCLGVNIFSVLAGQALLKMIAGIFIFLTMRTLFFSSVGFLAAVWFYVFAHNFFYTFNHAGGILAITIILWSIAKYIKDQEDVFLWIGLFFAFILTLIKINIGLVAILIVVIASLSTDLIQLTKFSSRKISFYLTSIIGLPLVIAATYCFFLKGLSWETINQCLPYFGSYQPYHTTIQAALGAHLSHLLERIKHNPKELLFVGIVLFSIVRTVQFIKNKNSRMEERKTLFVIIGILSLYYVLNFHEYLMSGIYYRGFWVDPVGIVWLFTMIAVCMGQVSKVIRVSIITIVTAIALVSQLDISQSYRSLYNSQHYFDDPRGKIFIGNDPQWIKTVLTTTVFLKEHVPVKETFLAFPYDPLYYYLAQRKSPTQLLNFIEMNHVSPKQETEIIHDLEKNHVNFVLLSNRIYSHEEGLGIFGQTYCPNLAQYFAKNFLPVARFGDWQHEGGWAWDHGTMILKRKAVSN